MIGDVLRAHAIGATPAGGTAPPLDLAALDAARRAGAEAPPGRDARTWPRWARHALGVTVTGLRVTLAIETRAPAVSLREAATSLRRALDRRSEAR